MSLCPDFDAVAVEEAQRYYKKLLSNLSVKYNSFHNFSYQILCLLGVLTNTCIILVLLRPAMRRNPFNLFLIAIAICDITLMASYFVYKSVELCHPLYFSYAWIVFTYVYAILSVFAHSASLWITVNMAVLRYLVLKASASSTSPKLNSYSATSVAIGLAIGISLIGCAPNTLRYKIHDGGQVQVPGICVENGSQYGHFYEPRELVNAYTLTQPDFWNCSLERISFWTAGLLLKIVPCLLLTIFMMLLIRTLMEARERRTRLTGPQRAIKLPAEENRRQSANAAMAKSKTERTTAMLTIIVAVFLITELPQGILVLAIGIQPNVRFAMHQLGNMIDLLSLVNSSVNFILYSTMSNLFRSEFLSTFGQCSVCLKRLLPSLRRFGKSNGDKNCQTVTTETAKLVEGATENMLIKLDDLNSRSKLAAKPQYRRVS